MLDRPVLGCLNFSGSGFGGVAELLIPSPEGSGCRHWRMRYEILGDHSMNNASKGAILITFWVFCMVLTADRELFGHGGRFILPSTKAGGGDDPLSGQGGAGQVNKTLVFPGSGPEMAYTDESWEYWWYFNGDPLIALKSVLFSLTPQAGYIDFPYEKVPEKKRVKIARFLSGLIRGEQDAIVREGAVLSLGRVRDESSLAHLKLAYYDDPDLYVRTMAVIAMGISRIPGVVDTLQSIFEDKKEYTEIRIYAAVGVGLAGGEGAREFFKKWLDVKNFKKLEDRRLQEAVAFGVGLTGDDAMAPLVRSALHNNLSKQRIINAYLIISLGKLGDRAANAILLDYLDHRDNQLRRSAAIALGAAASPTDKDVVEALIVKAQKDPENMVRKFSYIALGKIGGDRAEKFLLEELGRVKITNLPFVALAVGMSRNPKYGAKVLDRYGTTKNISTRNALAVSLGLLGYKPALGPLRKVVDGKGDPQFVGYHTLALGLLKDGESVERIKTVYMNSNNVEVHTFAALALGLIGDRSFAKEMYALLDRSTPDMRRISTAYNLGIIGDQRDVEILEDVVEKTDENSRLRALAVLALGHLADTAPFPVISLVTLDNNYTILENFMYELYNVN